MVISDRFAKLWDEWDGRLRAGGDVNSFLAGSKDEELIELLAGESARDRKYERDVVATEILNRLHRRHTDFPAGAEAVLQSAYAAQRSAESGQAAIHASEALLHAAGEHELGQSISESAYESLDATKLALDVAKHHAADVQDSLLQSRLRDETGSPRQGALDEPAQAAAAAARRGSDLMEDLESHMGAIGRGPEGKAAAEAGQAIRAAAEAAAKTAHDASATAKEDP